LNIQLAQSWVEVLQGFSSNGDPKKVGRAASMPGKRRRICVRKRARCRIELQNTGARQTKLASCGEARIQSG
jgi:hypothetical protein